MHWYPAGGIGILSQPNFPPTSPGDEKNMRVFLGGGVFVKDSDIIGVFDMDSVTVSKKSRNWLENLEQQNKVVYSNMYEFPRSVVLTDKNVFITPIATVTLKRRILKNII